MSDKKFWCLVAGTFAGFGGAIVVCVSNAKAATVVGFALVVVAAVAVIAGMSGDDGGRAP